MKTFGTFRQEIISAASFLNGLLDRPNTLFGNTLTAAKIYMCATEAQQNFNGVWYLSVIGFPPFLACLLLALLLKSKLMPVVLGPWLVDT